MPNDNLIAIGIVLDRSGSMQSVRADVIGGVNSFFQEQKDVPGEAKLTLAQFDNEYEVVHDFIDISEVPDLDENTFVPRGATALMDAIGRTINELSTKVAGMNEREQPGSVAMLIVTDGRENASREFNNDMIRSLIAQKRGEGWEINFLCTTEAMLREAVHSYGLDGGKSALYSADNAEVSMGLMSGKLGAYRGARQKGVSQENASSMTDFSDEERDELTGK